MDDRGQQMVPSASIPPRADTEPASPPASGAVLMPIRLVPVQVFGGNCACHEEHTANGGRCGGWGYGLMDAVGAGSDCNRAIGYIYRVDDLDGRGLQPDESVTVHVTPAQAEWFKVRRDED